jgi:hypothetical protein
VREDLAFLIVREDIVTITTLTTSASPTPGLLEEIRDGIEALASRYLNGQVREGWVMQHLIDRRPELSPWARWALWEDLLTTYQEWQDAESPHTDLGSLEPDRRNPEVYAEQTRAALDAALDTLIGGTR